MTQSINNVVLTFNITSPNSSYPSLFIASSYNTSSHIPPSVTTSFSNSTYCQESNKILISFIMHIPCLSICFIFFSSLANSLFLFLSSFNASFSLFSSSFSRNIFKFSEFVRTHDEVFGSGSSGILIEGRTIEREEDRLNTDGNGGDDVIEDKSGSNGWCIFNH